MVKYPLLRRCLKEKLDVAKYYIKFSFKLSIVGLSESISVSQILNVKTNKYLKHLKLKNLPAMV